MDSGGGGARERMDCCLLILLAVREREHRPHLAVSCAVTMWAGTDCEVQCGRIDSANTPTIAVDTAC